MKNGDKPKRNKKNVKNREETKKRDSIRPESTTPSYNENQDSHPKVVRKPTLVYPVSVNMPIDSGHPQEE